MDGILDSLKSFISTKTNQINVHKIISATLTSSLTAITKADYDANMYVAG